jgi:hypothetical protein
MAPINVPLRLPEFHGDLINHPEETWKRYLLNLDLAYAVAGASKDTVEKAQRAAHILQGLRGKARRYFELNPELKDKDLKDLESILEKKFGRASMQGLIDLTKIVQKPNESVMEFVARLKAAAEALMQPMKNITLATQQEIDDGKVDKKFARTAEQFKIEKAAFKEAAATLLMPYFMKGLRSDLRRAVAQDEPVIFSQAVERAERHEQYCEVYGAIGMANLAIGEAPKRNPVEEASRQLQALNNSPRKVSFPPQGEVKRFNPVQRQEPRREPRREPRKATADDRCHFCTKAGHFQRDCRAKTRYLEQVRAGQAVPRPALLHAQPQVQRRMPNLLPPRYTSPGTSSRRNEERGMSSWVHPINQSKNGVRPPRAMGGLGIPRAFPRQN